MEGGWIYRDDNTRCGTSDRTSGRCREGGQVETVIEGAEHPTVDRTKQAVIIGRVYKEIRVAQGGEHSYFARTGGRCREGTHREAARGRSKQPPQQNEWSLLRKHICCVVSTDGNITPRAERGRCREWTYITMQ